MEPINFLPLSIILVVFIIYFVCKVVACQRAMDKETFTPDLRLRRNQESNPQLQTQTSVPIQAQTPTETSVSMIFTISGLMGRTTRPQESPPTYDMPPTYDEAIKCGNSTSTSTVIPIER